MSGVAKLSRSRGNKPPTGGLFISERKLATNMKKSLIEVGKTYSDERGGIRRVTGIAGDEWGNIELLYVMIAGHRKDASRTEVNGLPVYGCYIQSFAAWAKKRVD